MTGPARPAKAAPRLQAWIYAFREDVEAGGLVSYGSNISDAYRLAATYVGRRKRCWPPPTR